MQRCSSCPPLIAASSIGRHGGISATIVGRLDGRTLSRMPKPSFLEPALMRLQRGDGQTDVVQVPRRVRRWVVANQRLVPIGVEAQGSGEGRRSSASRSAPDDTPRQPHQPNSADLGNRWTRPRPAYSRAPPVSPSLRSAVLGLGPSARGRETVRKIRNSRRRRRELVELQRPPPTSTTTRN